MKIVAVADLHGHLVNIPECDLLLIGGDFSPTLSHKLSYQYKWLDTTFRRWLESVPTKHICGCAGNHDLIFDSLEMKPPDLPWHYLQDSGCEIEGLKIWGSPWQKRFYDWAFNASETEMSQAWNKIPCDIDVLLLHGPVYGLGDYSTHGNVHTGSPSLYEKIKEIKPKLSVSGHIHSGYGVYNIDNTLVLNSSICDESYKPTNKPVIINTGREKWSVEA